MEKIEMPIQETKNFLEVFEMIKIFQYLKTVKGIADVIIKNYKYHIKNSGNYMTRDRSFDVVTIRLLPNMVAAMRQTQMVSPL